MNMLILALVVVGFLVNLAGGLLFLVAAFRESVWWGLACFFIPFASLIFLIKYWESAKTGFATTVVGAVVMFAALFSSAEARQAFLKSYSGPGDGGKVSSSKDRATEEISGKIQARRTHIIELQEEYARTNAEVNREYKELIEKRKSLKIRDREAVRMFNEENASYQKQNLRLTQINKEIATTTEEVSDLLGERTKLAPPVAQKNTSKRVVMYTTASCPACRAAKDYFARRGIAYQEIDVQQSRDGYEEFKRLGGNGVPLIIVGDEKMEGFSAARLDSLL